MSSLAFTPKKVGEMRFYTGDFFDDLKNAGEPTDGSTITASSVALLTYDRSATPSGMLGAIVRSGTKVGAWISGGAESPGFWVIFSITLASTAIMTHEVFLDVVP
jgi:hypothetical protein